MFFPVSDEKNRPETGTKLQYSSFVPKKKLSKKRYETGKNYICNYVNTIIPLNNNRIKIRHIKIKKKVK